MIFIRMEDGEWINVSEIKRIYAKQVYEGEAEVICYVDGWDKVVKSFVSIAEAQSWLDDYMRWSVNGG